MCRANQNASRGLNLNFHVARDLIFAYLFVPFDLNWEIHRSRACCSKGWSPMDGCLVVCPFFSLRRLSAIGLIASASDLPQL